MSIARPTGVSLGYWQDRDPIEALATAELADRLGYAELWLGEMATFDVFALAAAVGLRTASIRLTLGPLPPAVRDPAMLAMGVASVACLTGRDTSLAVGSSSPVVVEQWHGRRSQGIRDLRQAVHDVKTLLAGARTSASGYRLRLPALATPAVTVAAFGPAAVRLAGEVADRMVINLCTPQQAAALRQALDAATVEAGRGRVPLAAWVPVAVDPTDETVEQIRRALVPYLAAPGYGEMFIAAGFGELVTAARAGVVPSELLRRTPRELVEAVAAVGTIAECRRSLAAYTTAGVDELVVVPATAGDPAGERTLTALSGA